MNISRILAPNPGMFTGTGTNTWLVESEGRVVIIDSGPDIEEHQEAIRRAVDQPERWRARRRSYVAYSLRRRRCVPVHRARDARLPG